MRLFIAIRLSEELCRKIAAYQRALRAQGLRVESLARIAEMDDSSLRFC